MIWISSGQRCVRALWGSHKGHHKIRVGTSRSCAGYFALAVTGRLNISLSTLVTTMVQDSLWQGPVPIATLGNASCVINLNSNPSVACEHGILVYLQKRT
jgi:hypothetical protein